MIDPDAVRKVIRVGTLEVKACSLDPPVYPDSEWQLLADFVIC